MYGYFASPIHRAAPGKLGPDGIGAFAFRKGRYLSEFQVERRKGLGGRRCAGKITEREGAADDLGVPYQEARRGTVCRFRVFRLGECVRKRFEIEAAVLLELQVDRWPFDSNIGKCPCPAKKTGQLKVYEQAIESKNGPSVRFLKCKLVGFKCEQERVDANLGEGCLAIELFCGIAGYIAFQQPGGQQETTQGIQHHCRNPAQQPPVEQYPPPTAGGRIMDICVCRLVRHDRQLRGTSMRYSSFVQ